MKYRTGGLQVSWDSEQVVCRTGGMHDWPDAGKEGFMRGMQERSLVVEPEPPFLLEPVSEKRLLQLWPSVIHIKKWSNTKL